MSFKPTFRTRVLLGDFSLSSKLSSCSLPHAIDMHDPTTFEDTAKRAQPGLETSTLSVEGFIDAATVADLVAWTTAQPFTYAHEGLALGSPVLLVNALKASFEPGTQVGGLASFSLNGQTDGQTDYGISLHDLTAETADVSGTAHDGTAATANGGVAQLHVTAFSGFSGATVIVEDSATGSSGWATIATFAAVSAVTAERVAISGTVRRYLRYSIDVTGSGSVSFQVSFARR